MIPFLLSDVRNLVIAGLLATLSALGVYSKVQTSAKTKLQTEVSGLEIKLRVTEGDLATARAIAEEQSKQIGVWQAEGARFQKQVDEAKKQHCHNNRRPQSSALVHVLRNEEILLHRISP